MKDKPRHVYLEGRHRGIVYSSRHTLAGIEKKGPREAITLGSGVTETVGSRDPEGNPEP